MIKRDQVVAALKALPSLPPKAIRAVAVGASGVQVTLAVEAEADKQEVLRRAVVTAVKALGAPGEVAVHFTQTQAKGSPHSKGRLELPNVKRILAVGAGKGGVGKSTVAVHLAVGLRRSGAAVGLLDADVYGPSIATMLNFEGEPPAMLGQRILPHQVAGLRAVSMASFAQAGAPMIWRGPMVHSVIRQLLGDVEWGELDYLVVDLPPGTGDVPLTLVQSAAVSGAVLVTTPQPVAMNDAVRAARMYQQLGIPLLGLVENMSHFVCDKCGAVHDLFGRGSVAKAAEALGVPLLGEIPTSAALRTNTDTGQAERDFDTPGPVADAVNGLVRNLLSRLSSADS